MGNPGILRSPDSRAPVLPPALRVLWLVYKLREAGQPLTREQVMRTGQLGRIEFYGRPGDPMIARLVHPTQDTVLENLFKVELCPPASGRVVNGLLLTGEVLATMRGGGFQEVPQTWWCKVQRLVTETEESLPK